MARFLHGLNGEIQDVVELQHYGILGELVHQAIKVEMQIRRMYASRKSYVSTSGWKEKERDEDRLRKEKSPKKGSEPSQGRKEVTSIPTPNASRTKSDDRVRDFSKAKGLSDDSRYGGDLLVVRRLMNSQIGDEAKTQKENIFHSRCLILDGGSYVIVASERLMKKLALPTIGELLVNKQVEVTFTLGAYDDRVVCDVIPIKATYLLFWSQEWILFPPQELGLALSFVPSSLYSVFILSFPRHLSWALEMSVHPPAIDSLGAEPLYRTASSNEYGLFYRSGCAQVSGLALFDWVSHVA
ncbi:hypothetical protein CR513_47690, partial [Mucuna pruriens]